MCDQFVCVRVSCVRVLISSFLRWVFPRVACNGWRQGGEHQWDTNFFLSLGIRDQKEKRESVYVGEKEKGFVSSPQTRASCVFCFFLLGWALGKYRST